MNKKANEIVLRDQEFSVSELHSLLRTQELTAESCLTIDGSCNITQHEGDIVKGEPEIRLKQLTVKANMSSQSLQALLIPLAVGKVTLQQCIILDEGKENNKFIEPIEVVSVFIIFIFIIFHWYFSYSQSFNSETKLQMDETLNEINVTNKHFCYRTY